MRLRRTKSLVVTFAASLMVAVGALLGLDLWWRHDRAVQAAETRVANLSIALSEYVRGAFTLADTSLGQLAIHGRRVGGSGAPDSDWLPILEASRVALPASGSLSVTDAAGVIRHSTVAAIVGQSRQETYVFRYLAANDSEGLIVDVPFPSPLEKGRYLIPVGRRLEAADGRFDGIVVAVLLPDAFRNFFRTIDVGRAGVISVFHPNGDVLFREPSTSDPLGERAPGHPVVRAAQQPPGRGLITSALEPGGQTYITGYRTLPTPPLIISASLDQQEVLQDWQEQRRTAASGFTLFAGTLFVLVTLLVRQIDARSTVERALVDVQRGRADRLREANERLAAALENERHTREEAEAAGRLKDEFLMTLSHELRTPLNAIMGWVRMLLGGAIDENHRDRALRTVERNGRTLTRLVEDLLDVSRAITGRLHVSARPVDLADTVLAAVETLRPAIAAKGITFTSEMAPDLAPLHADADRLQQVLWNLLSNAIKFTPAGGSVQLRVAAAGGGIEMVVTDTGKGIAPAFLPFVFDRFRQADAGTRRETGGLGLGLAIARHLVELHGGTITAESAGEDCGSTFRVFLPAQPSGAGNPTDPPRRSS